MYLSSHFSKALPLYMHFVLHVFQVLWGILKYSYSIWVTYMIILYMYGVLCDLYSLIHRNKELLLRDSVFFSIPHRKDHKEWQPRSQESVQLTMHQNIFLCIIEPRHIYNTIRDHYSLFGKLQYICPIEYGSTYIIWIIIQSAAMLYPSIEMQ